MADPRKGEQHANRAREMLRQGRLADAERELRAAVASDPSRGDWMLNLGWTLEAIGRQDEALQLFRQSASLLPTARDPRLAEGLMLAKLARHDEAATAFESVLKLDPKCETAASMLIRSLAMAGRHEEAETGYYLALHSIDRPATSHLEIARSLLARGDLKRAEHCFRRAIAEGPTLSGARIELARVLLLAGRGADTAVLLAEEFRRGGVPSHLALEAVRIHLATGRTAEASQILEQLARNEPSNPRLHLLLARTMRRRADLSRATRHIEIASRLASELPGLAYEAALISLARGVESNARDVLAKEFEARPLGHLAPMPDRVAPMPDRVAPMPDRVAPMPDRVDLIEIVGALLSVGLIDQAERALHGHFGTDIRRAHSGDIEALRLGARLSLERGDLREGRARSRRLLRLDPTSMVALHNLALIAIERRDFASASGWIGRARAINPSDAGIRKLRTLLWWRRITSRLLPRH
jgi:tetratricopeptide (TPR) repeat protein